MLVIMTHCQSYVTKEKLMVRMHQGYTSDLFMSREEKAASARDTEETNDDAASPEHHASREAVSRDGLWKSGGTR